MPHLSNPFFLMAVGSGVKSVQRGSLTMPGNDPSVDVTISAVNVNKSILKHSSTTECTINYLSHALFVGEIVDSTTIRFSRSDTSSCTGAIIDWELIEFY